MIETDLFRSVITYSRGQVFKVTPCAFLQFAGHAAKLLDRSISVHRSEDTLDDSPCELHYNFTLLLDGASFFLITSYTDNIPYHFIDGSVHDCSISSALAKRDTAVLH